MTDDAAVLAGLLAEATIAENPLPADYVESAGHVYAVSTFPRALTENERRVWGEYWQEATLALNRSTHTDEAGNRVTSESVRGMVEPK